MNEINRSSMRWSKKISYLVTFFLVALCIYEHAYLPLSLFADRGLYLGLCSIIFFFLYYPSCKKLYDKVLLIIATIAEVGVCVYIILSDERIIESFYRANNTDYLVVLIYLIATYILLRKYSGGKVVAGLGILGFLYLKFGHLLNNVFAHKLFSNTQIATMLLTDSDKGAFGSLMGVVTRILSIFFIFASLLVACGLGDLITALANYLLGNQKGGPAKIGVITSGLFGMISGSPVANAAAVGSFTIPLMKQVGYSSKMSAAIIAIASCGGGLVPPVMGLGAFIMADILGVSYIKICLWGIIPAILWYWTTYWIVDNRAYFLDLKTWRPRWEEVRGVIKEKWLIGLSIVAIIFLLVTIQIAEEAAFWGVVTLFILSLFKKGTRLNLKRLITFLEDFAKSFAPICLMISCLGIFTSALMSTGAHIKLGLLIFGGITNWFLVCLIVFILCIIFGMIVPVVVAYLAVALIAVPIMVNFGFSPALTHMFVFYCCTLAPITPPVALSVVTTSSLAGTDPMKTGLYATWISLPLWFIPFILIKSEVFLGMTRPVNEVLFWFALMCLGSFIFTVGVIGNLRGISVNRTLRIILIIISLCILQPFIENITIWGSILGVLVLAYLIFKNRRSQQKVKLD